MLTGPPGTGKSRLLSLFYDLLPTRHKRRWHYHAFTLYLYRQVFVEMERRRHEQPVQVKVENMEKAAKSGWKSVFAGGRWENGEDFEANVEVYARSETIPFVSESARWCWGREEAVLIPVAKNMIMDYHIL